MTNFVTVAEYRAPTRLTAALSSAAVWLEAARTDYALCRALADRFDARLPRSSRCQRLAWGQDADTGYGLIIPDLLPPQELKDDEWYVYNVELEVFVRIGCGPRERSSALILPDGVEDWVELFRQAVNETVFNVSFEVVPIHIDAFGDIEMEPSGCMITIRSSAPNAVALQPFHVMGSGDTPEYAARECCRKWLKEHPAT